MSGQERSVDHATGEEVSPVLVVVLNNQQDSLRVQLQKWYRIPIAHAPSRIGADFLAFYHTGAFPPDQRWRITSYAPVRRVHICSRREIIPDEPDHPRSDSLYYKIDLGPLVWLDSPIPSKRLRRLTFLPTTLDRLLSAGEINQLWIRTSSQERLWNAFVQAGLEPEMHYPLREDLPLYVVDFAFICRRDRIGLTLQDDAEGAGAVHEKLEEIRAYLSAAESWTILSPSGAEVEQRTAEVVRQVRRLIDAAGGLSPASLPAS